MKKILVTGGAGYIGSHTIVELFKANYEPIIVDNMCNSDERNIRGINKIIGREVKHYKIDCTNEKKFSEVFEREGSISGVIHFAAFKSVEESVRKPEKYYHNNINSLKILLKLMKKYTVNNIIFSSSCTVYGNPDKLPVNESTYFKTAESPYGETKQKCEEILKKSDLNSVSLRYFNPIGSHESGLIGDCSADKPANLIPIICEVAKGKRDELIINGNDYCTHDGTCIRDYIHVVDLSKAHVSALSIVQKENKKYIFNVGTGKGTSVLEAIQIFEKANNIKIKFSIGKRRKGDVEQIYSCNKLVKKILKWKPKKSMKDSMISAWNWENNK